MINTVHFFLITLTRPTVIPDLVFANPIYKSLLRQSLEDFWSSEDPLPRSTPVPTAWIQPWLQSLSHDCWRKPHWWINTVHSFLITLTGYEPSAATADMTLARACCTRCSGLWQKTPPSANLARLPASAPALTRWP
ncbi:hypothetical protein ACQKWADRAFT_291672 [Trichoderma austrokoningii]